MKQDTPFDNVVLRAVCDEVGRSASGGVVQQVTQPSASVVCLGVRTPGQTIVIALSADPVTAHMGVARRQERSGGQPPAFCMAMRKHLMGARLEACRQVGFDRIADLRLTRSDGEPVRLIGEFMGRHSNLLLVGPDGRILDCIRHASARVNRVRTLLPGYDYHNPPALQPDPSSVDALAAWAIASEAGKPPMAGLSPWLVERVTDAVTGSAAGTGALALLEAISAGAWEWTEYRDGDGAERGIYPVPLPPPPGQAVGPVPDGPIRVHLLLSRRDVVGKATEASGALERDIRGALAARTASIAELERVQLDAGRAETVRQEADLLMANLHRVPEAAVSVVLDDYYAPGATRTIGLDPDLSALENATRRYAHVKRLVAGAEVRAGRVAMLKEEAAQLEAALAEGATLANAAVVGELRARLVGGGLLRAEVSVQQQVRADVYGGKRVRSTTVEGWEILWGENAEANDYLTSRLADPEDIWLHARAVSSAHVVIRTHRKPDKVPISVIREAAALAGSHSAAKHSSVISVDYTRKKYVRRPRSASPGQVLYTNERTITVSTCPSPTKPGT